MTIDEFTDISRLILDLEQEGLVTRTFRRLDPARQQVVIRAIFDDAVENGPQAINIKSVAARAEVAVGSLYQYFGSRSGLLDFAITLAVRLTKSQFEYYRQFLIALPLREALQAYGSGAMEWAGESGGFVRFFSRAAYGGDPLFSERVVRPIAETLLAMVMDILTGAQARGELRPGVDLEAAARAINALNIALIDPLLLPYLNVYFQISGPGVPPERTFQAAIEMIVNGIAK